MPSHDTRPLMRSATGRLTRSIELPLDLARVFAFFSDAANLGVITPPELQFRIHTPLPIAMAEGTLIDYTIRLWGAPLHWRTRIVQWNAPHSFVDEQLRGPYKSWVHTHRFSAIPGGTLMEDEVDWTLPLGPAGFLAAPVVRRQVARIFAYREQQVKALLKAEEFSAVAT